jgi:hypothetical protein
LPNLGGVAEPTLSRTASRKNIRFDLNVEAFEDTFSSSVSSTQYQDAFSPQNVDVSQDPPTLLHAADEYSSSSDTAGRGMRLSSLSEQTGRRAKMRLGHDEDGYSSSEYSDSDEGILIFF